MTRIIVIRLVYLLILLTGSISMALATPRTALVIGNGAYQNAPLGNPPADARTMAAKLRELDFQVIEVIDVDRTEMRNAIRDFSQLLRTRGGVGLFFYAGHGVQVGGNNFLLPVGVDIQQAFEVPDEALDMNSVLRAMEHAGNDMNVVILDACRNNPFTRSFRSVDQGLARMEGPTGSLIAYSTAPGSVAADGEDSNSPYTSRLLDAMDTPGLSLEQVFKRVREGVVQMTNGAQVPWEHSSLLGEFYFRPDDADGLAIGATTTTAATAADVNTSGGDTDQALELTFWESIQDSDEPAYFQAYLEQYPQGNFATLAKLKLDGLAVNPPVSRSADPAPATTESPPPATAPPPPAADAEIQRIVQAAQDGDPIAQGLLGRLFASGQGVPQDMLRGYIWSTLAAQRGVQDAVPVGEFAAQYLNQEQRRLADRQLAELMALYQPEEDRDNPKAKSKKPKKPKKSKKKHGKGN